MCQRNLLTSCIECYFEQKLEKNNKITEETIYPAPSIDQALR